MPDVTDSGVGGGCTCVPCGHRDRPFARSGASTVRWSTAASPPPRDSFETPWRHRTRRKSHRSPLRQACRRRPDRHRHPLHGDHSNRPPVASRSPACSRSRSGAGPRAGFSGGDPARRGFEQSGYWFRVAWQSAARCGGPGRAESAERKQ